MGDLAPPLQGNRFLPSTHDTCRPKDLKEQEMDSLLEPSERNAALITPWF